MANGDDNQSNEIPPNIQSVLFAEDLVNYVLHQYSLPGISYSTEQERTFGVRIFNDELRILIDIINSIYRLETEQTYDYIMERNLYTVEWFALYAENVKGRKFKCPYPEDVLHYSVHLTHLAAKLCAKEFETAPEIAAYYISYTWNLHESEINVVFEKYVNDPRISDDMCYQRLSFEEDEFFTSVYQLAMHTPHVHRCKPLTEIKAREKKDKMDERIDKLSTTLSCQSLSDSESKNSTVVFDTRNGNAYNVLSSDSIGVPGSSRGESTSLDSQESFPADSSEDKNTEGKKTQLQRDI